MNRNRILLAALFLLIAVGVWRWLFSEPTITLNVKDAPLAKVLQEFERQGRIKLISNVDPAKTVTLYFDKAPVFDALETLAVRADASWRLAYFAAPQKAQIDAVIAAFTNKDTSQPAWNSYQLRGGGGGSWMGSETPIDPRKSIWQVTPGDSKELGGYFAQLAQKTPAFFALAPDWNPLVEKVPNSGQLKKAVPQLVSQTGGAIREIFLLDGRQNFRPEGDFGDGQPPAGGPPNNVNQGPRREVFANVLRREQTNPEWMAQRAEEAIKTLPPAEQAQARQDMQEMRAFMDEMRKLAPEERRAKMEAAMNDPAVTARMDRQMASRDARSSPAQREQRAKNYIERKTAAREKAGNPVQAKN